MQPLFSSSPSAIFHFFSTTPLSVIPGIFPLPDLRVSLVFYFAPSLRHVLPARYRLPGSSAFRSLRAFREGHGPIGRPLPFPLMSGLPSSGTFCAVRAVPGPEVEFIVRFPFRRPRQTAVGVPIPTPHSQSAHALP
jgi:hypothetical protein